MDGQPAPSRNDEYLFYQILVGIWPLAARPTEAALAAAGRPDASATWRRPPTRRRSTRVGSIPTPSTTRRCASSSPPRSSPAPKNRFLAEFHAFHEQVVNWGLFNALSQTLLKLTSPGVPDIYQGQELWDFSLVDPDNRRPVDFALRRELLSELQREVCAGHPLGEVSPGGLPPAGRPANETVCRLAGAWSIAAPHAELFHQGEYVPLGVEGVRAEHVCAYTWRGGAGSAAEHEGAVVIAPRLLAKLTRGLDVAADREAVPLGPAVWQDTHIVLPDWASHQLQLICLPGDCVRRMQVLFAWLTLSPSFLWPC